MMRSALGCRIIRMRPSASCRIGCGRRIRSRPVAA
jgi:hypothetical protein